jgi:multiple sugar transport system ATP-binding protein
MKRRPFELSGGQRQRVAIGRALVRDVEVFLFDEPLSNLDAKLRTELRVELKKLHIQLGSTMIYVTHDQIEALTLADRIAVMHNGLIQQLASPKEIYRRPINRFVAGFVGSPAMNFMEGKTKKANGSVSVELDGGGEVSLNGYPFANAPAEGQPIALGVRPEQFSLAPNGGPRVPVTVSLVDPMGADSLLWGNVGSSAVSVRIGAEEHYAIGDTVSAGFDPSAASVFDTESGNRL